MATPWLQRAAQHSKLLRPFPTRRLSDALFHVQQDAGAIDSALTSLLIDQPATADEWVGELDRIDALLESLQGRCGEARTKLEGLASRAEGDYQRAIDAMVLLMAGMSGPDEVERAAAA